MKLQIGKIFGKAYAQKIPYSAKEIKIGKWINDKNLYRKVIACGSLPNSSSTSTNHQIQNLDKIVNVNGVAIRNSTKTFLPIPYTNIGILIGTSSVTIETVSDRSSFDESFVILEYTKTTD